MIPQLKALDVNSKISEEQLCSSISDNYATFLVISTFFKEEVAWQPLIKLESCSLSILEPLTRAFIWGTVCFLPILVVEKLRVMSKNVKFHYIKLKFFDIILNFSTAQMVERQTVPHMNAPVGGSKILREQLSSLFMGCHTTSSLKNVLITRKVLGLSLIKLHSCFWQILEPFVCLAQVILILIHFFIKYSNPADGYICAAVYLW